MTLTFAPNQGSVRRWIYDDIERAVLAVHRDDGAAHSLAVSINAGHFRVRDVNGVIATQAIIDRAQAAERGLGVAHVSLDDDEPINEQSGRQTNQMDVVIYVELPPENEWSGMRAEDVADALDRDLIRAVMHDRQRSGLAINTTHAGGGAVEFDLQTQTLGFERRFRVQYRHMSTDAQAGAPAGVPTPPAAHDVFALWRDDTPDGDVTEVESATATLGGGQLRLYTLGVAAEDPENPGLFLPAPEIEVNLALAAHTVQSLIDAIDGEIGWHADPLTVDAGALAAPADDLATFAETNVLTEPNAVTVEIKA